MISLCLVPADGAGSQQVTYFVSNFTSINISRVVDISVHFIVVRLRAIMKCQGAPRRHPRLFISIRVNGEAMSYHRKRLIIVLTRQLWLIACCWLPISNLHYPHKYREYLNHKSDLDEGIIQVENLY